MQIWHIYGVQKTTQNNILVHIYEHPIHTWSELEILIQEVF